MRRLLLTGGVVLTIFFAPALVVFLDGLVGVAVAAVLVLIAIVAALLFL